MAKAKVTVRVRGIDHLFSKVREIQDLDGLREVIEAAANIASTTAKAKAPHFSGQLRGSFVTDIDPFSAVVHTPLTHARIMEFGRKPNADKMPPPRSLEVWARAHGITSTYALAKSIQKRGTKGRFFRRKGRVAVRKALPGLLDRWARKMESAWDRRAIGR